jgi:hypothetical protein
MNTDDDEDQDNSLKSTNRGDKKEQPWSFFLIRRGSLCVSMADVDAIGEL